MNYYFQRLSPFKNSLENEKSNQNGMYQFLINSIAMKHKPVPLKSIKLQEERDHVRALSQIHFFGHKSRRMSDYEHIE